MSQAAVMVAVRDALRTAFNLDADSCEVGFGPEPKPGCGQLYVAVHGGRWGGISGDYDLGEEYEVLVTITMRMGQVPKDRWGIAVWLASPEGGAGLEAHCRTAITTIHQSQAVRVAANTHITGGGGNILTALLLSPGGVQPARPRGPDWFSAAPPQTDADAVECGVSQTIAFNRCQRVQNITDMD